MNVVPCSLRSRADAHAASACSAPGRAPSVARSDRGLQSLPARFMPSAACKRSPSLLSSPRAIKPVLPRTRSRTNSVQVADAMCLQTLAPFAARGGPWQRGLHAFLQGRALPWPCTASPATSVGAAPYTCQLIALRHHGKLPSITVTIWPRCGCCALKLEDCHKEAAALGAKDPCKDDSCR